MARRPEVRRSSWGSTLLPPSLPAFCLTAAAALFPPWLAQQPASARAQDGQAAYAEEMQKGEAALERRQFEDALKAFTRASELRKQTSAEAHLGMARAHHGLGAFKSAVGSCKEAAKHDGEDRGLLARISNQLGLSLFASSKKPGDKPVREAEAAFRSALALDERLLVARYNLGVALLRQSQDPQGIEELTAYVTAAGGSPEAAEARRMIADPRRAREPFAPDFTIVTLDERRLTLGDLRGNVVLLDFWATWCPPCVAATPALVNLHKKYKDEPFTIVGISLDHNDGAWRAYIDKNKLEWPQYYDRGGRMSRLFGVQPIPTYVLLDHDGIVRGTRAGWSSTIAAWLDGEVKKYLKAMKEDAQR